MKFLLCGDPKELTESSNKASIDTMYIQMYEEMRRHRNQELEAAKWYTSIILAIIGGLTTLASNQKSYLLFARFSACEKTISQIALGIIILLLAISGIGSVIHSHKRYEEIRDLTDDIEPRPKPKLTDPIFPPNLLIIISLISVSVFSILLIAFM